MTFERAQALLFELGDDDDINGAGVEARRIHAMKAANRFITDPKDRFSEAKVIRLWSGYADKIEVLAHEYLALVEAVKQKVRDQDALIHGALRQTQRRARRELEELENGSADIEEIIRNRLGGRADGVSTRWKQAVKTRPSHRPVGRRETP